MRNYYGHTNPNDPPYDKARWQPLKEHALNVAARARRKAEVFGEGERAERAGKLHDLGKYGELFQKRLEGIGSGYDHWSIGACCANAASGFNDPALALVIQGHHIGLQKGDEQTLAELTPQKVKARGEGKLTEPEPNDTSVAFLVKRMIADGVPLSRPKPAPRPVLEHAADMLDTRMLFSALVDADYLDTEEAMRRDSTPPRPENELLDAARALTTLEARLQELGQGGDVPEKTRRLRADLMEACREAGWADERLWTLTAPTGSGKTLAMLLFALTRAARLQAEGKPLRRIIVVLPFLSILDQTAQQYRELFTLAGFGPDFVLEHHSLAGTRTNNTGGDQGDAEAQGTGPGARLFVQNWDAPIIITTNVQLLESLHANKPSACRKLHRLAQSVILFDEVQTLPAALVVPTLKTLSRLTTEKYGAVVVMATATQPAFDTLSSKVLEAGKNDGWQPREMVPVELGLFPRSKRVLPVWKLDEGASWEVVRGWICREDQVLCIVNMRKHALELAQSLKAEEGLRHLSTYLCPSHRREILAQMRLDLKTGKKVRAVATSCVEAGVDISFPKVFRALAPLDSIAQAAGRCNRHGELPSGELCVFLPQDEEYPTPAYRTAAQVALTMYRTGELDLDNPETFRRFYAKLWHYVPTELEELKEAILTQDYPEVARLYRLIPNDSVNVVVPYGRGPELMAQARQDGISVEWMREVQPYTISVFRTRDGVMPVHLEPVNFRPRWGTPQPAPDWYLAHDGSYDPMFGYLPDGGEADPYTKF